MEFAMERYEKPSGNDDAWLFPVSVFVIDCIGVILAPRSNMSEH
jgi:hypothetical protein